MVLFWSFCDWLTCCPCHPLCLLWVLWLPCVVVLRGCWWCLGWWLFQVFWVVCAFRCRWSSLSFGGDWIGRLPCCRVGRLSYGRINRLPYNGRVCRLPCGRIGRLPDHGRVGKLPCGGIGRLPYCGRVGRPPCGRIGRLHYYGRIGRLPFW